MALLDYELTQSVACLHFDDGKANVVSHALIDALNEGLDRAQAEAEAIVLLGMPGKFSAGFDLEEFKKGPEASAALVNRGGRLMHRIFTLPMPVVAGCTGHAIAAGAFMLLACDIRIGIDGPYKIGANESVLGMTLPTFASELIEYRVPRDRLDRVVLKAELMAPSSALSCGFLDEIVEEDTLVEYAQEVAANLAAYPGQGYAGNKHLLRNGFASRILASL